MRIKVNHQHAMAEQGNAGRQVHHGSGFADTTFLIGNGDNSRGGGGHSPTVPDGWRLNVPRGTELPGLAVQASPPPANAPTRGPSGSRARGVVR